MTRGQLCSCFSNIKLNVSLMQHKKKIQHVQQTTRILACQSFCITLSKHKTTVFLLITFLTLLWNINLAAQGGKTSQQKNKPDCN